MEFVQEGLERIQEAQGIPLSITGMLVVFTALALISLFIGALPKILGAVSVVFPDKSTKAVADDERIIAAIGAALHYQKYRQGGE